MNKNLIALAVAAAVVAPTAFAADNEVVLYGQVNVAVQAGKTNGTSAPDQTAVNNLSSRIGFKGQEDLGGGNSAFFLIETGIAPDNSALSDKFAGREGWVGLKGDFGSIKLGRGKSIYTLTTEELDPWYQDQSLGLTSNSSDYRVNNSVRYEYAAGPLSIAISNAFGENKTATQSASNEASVSAKYATDDFSIFGAYANTKLGNAQPHTTRLVVGGNFIMGDLSVGIAGQRREEGSVKMTEPLVLVGYTIGNLNLQAGLIDWDKKTHSETKAQGNLAGYYSLSKRTVALVEYATNYTGEKGNDVLSIGLSHSF